MYEYMEQQEQIQKKQKKASQKKERLHNLKQGEKPNEPDQSEEIPVSEATSLLKEDKKSKKQQAKQPETKKIAKQTSNESTNSSTKNSQPTTQTASLLPTSGKKSKGKSSAKLQSSNSKQLISEKFPKIKPIPTKANSFAQLKDSIAQDDDANDSSNDSDQNEAEADVQQEQEEPAPSQARKTLQLPQKFIEQLFFSKSNAAYTGKGRRSAAAASAVISSKVRMVDSETQTSDDLLEDLLMEKIQDAYERRRSEFQKGSSKSQIDLDFERV